MKRVLDAPTVRGRVGQGTDDLEHLDDRTGPAVRDDQWQRVLVARLDVDEVDIEPVELGDELRQRVQLRLAPAPVVAGAPVGNQGLDRRQLHALRPICDEFPAGPARGRDALLKVSQVLIRHMYLEWAEGGIRNGHASLLSAGVQPLLLVPSHY